MRSSYYEETSLQQAITPVIFQQLLPDPQNCNPSGRTALHLALGAPGCATTVLDALLGGKADPNARDNDGETPLHYAVRFQSPSITQLLLKACADPHARNNRGHTPLFCATLDARHDETCWSEHLVALHAIGANIDDPDSDGVTPLYHAISTRSVQTACLLLRLGADPYAGQTQPVQLRVAVGMVGNANIEAIIAVVTRAGLDTSDWVSINSESDQCASLRDLSQSEEGCKVLFDALRKEMFKQPSSKRKEFIVQLSKLYSILGYYPSDPALDACEIEDPKGRASIFGGFADCWQSLFLGRHPVAMKALRREPTHEDAVRRLMREASVWRHLIHRNVLPFLGVYTLDSVPYLISPWMEYGHATDYVKGYPNADPLRLLADVADGIEYLHTFKPEPVIHGDLRGPNILISPSGNARIADFGLTELRTDVFDPDYSTKFHKSGHPRWKAREIIFAETKEAAQRNTTTDIYAFGRVMLELFTAEVPFFNVQETMVIVKVWEGELPQRPCDDKTIARGLDDKMWQLMTDCWHSTPSKRPSVAHVVARLAEALESRSGSNFPSSPAIRRLGKVKLPPKERGSSPSQMESSPGEQEPESSSRPKKRFKI
ncbi:hypothetical protein BOTBODRAFT_590033 [Botryobasidium botryosum FD-172 SS1]|uniref:Protein kinase domain-containing protein n=1 Tax=Botryobasidium botryosum (strain FD-172 SS1) TaxID=930990 RepID=A0A067LXF3_BOTB1|nr:hypothetical protein BOTBODRAFT_590033 [Botryobasidium botryosum FD-172 SS1]